MTTRTTKTVGIAADQAAALAARCLKATSFASSASLISALLRGPDGKTLKPSPPALADLTGTSTGRTREHQGVLSGNGDEIVADYEVEVVEAFLENPRVGGELQKKLAEIDAILDKHLAKELVIAQKRDEEIPGGDGILGAVFGRLPKSIGGVVDEVKKIQRQLEARAAWLRVDVLEEARAVVGRAQAWTEKQGQNAAVIGGVVAEAYKIVRARCAEKERQFQQSPLVNDLPEPVETVVGLAKRIGDEPEAMRQATARQILAKALRAGAETPTPEELADSFLAESPIADEHEPTSLKDALAAVAKSYDVAPAVAWRECLGDLNKQLLDATPAITLADGLPTTGQHLIQFQALPMGQGAVVGGPAAEVRLLNYVGAIQNPTLLGFAVVEAGFPLERVAGFGELTTQLEEASGTTNFFILPDLVRRYRPQPPPEGARPPKPGGSPPPTDGGSPPSVDMASGSALTTAGGESASAGITTIGTKVAIVPVLATNHVGSD